MWKNYLPRIFRKDLNKILAYGVLAYRFRKTNRWNSFYLTYLNKKTRSKTSIRNIKLKLIKILEILNSRSYPSTFLAVFIRLKFRKIISRTLCIANQDKCIINGPRVRPTPWRACLNPLGQYALHACFEIGAEFREREIKEPISKASFLPVIRKNWQLENINSFKKRYETSFK